MEYFRGTTESVKSDNMRQWVKRSDLHEPTFNEAALQWGLHYDTELTATRPVHPKDKAPVEGLVNKAYQYIYARMRNDVFYSLEALNSRIFELLDEFNSRKMQGCAYSRMERFEEIELPFMKPLPAEQLVGKMAEAELFYRNQRRTEMYLKTRKLRYNAIMEEVICSAERNFTKDQLLALSDCSFINKAENLLIEGKTGCGKSYLACALGRQACYLGYRVEYFSMNKFVEKIALSKIDGTLLKVINHIEKNDLIIFDDFGLQPLDNNSRLALLQIFEDCYERKAVIITSQLPIKKWYDYIGEPTLADAIMDRLTSNANRIELKGESMRRKK